MPAHGEYRHLVEHSRLAQSLGQPSGHIYVMQNGTVTESGRHAELLNRNGVYANLWRVQAALEAYGKEAV